MSSEEPKRRRRRSRGHPGIVGKLSRRMEEIALALAVGTVILLFFAWLGIPTQVFERLIFSRLDTSTSAIQILACSPAVAGMSL